MSHSGVENSAISCRWVKLWVKLSVAVVVMVHCALLRSSTASAVDLDDSTYRNRSLGLKLEVPDGWTLHRQTGFPSLLLLLSHKESAATISLATADLPPKSSMAHFLAENRSGLLAVGIKVFSTKQVNLSGRPAWRLHAQANGGTTEVRQIHLPYSDRVFMLTLSCPKPQVQQLAIELNQLLEVLEIRRPEPRDPRHLEPASDDPSTPRPPAVTPPAPGQGPSQELSPEDDIGGSRIEGMEPGSRSIDSRPGPAPSKSLDKSPSYDSRPSGDDSHTVDSRPNKPRKQRAPASGPTSGPSGRPLPEEPLKPLK